MEDEECAKMFIHLQQYVPHLDKLISQLKDPKKENRELQLNKLEGLYSMITDKKKKLKLDTLRKCEDVILKILQKVNPNIVRQLKPFVPLNDAMTKFCTLKEDLTQTESVRDSKFFDQIKFQAARARLNVISTPASPSPPKDSIPLKHLPIVIPTEKIKSPPDPHLYSINNWIIPLTRKESNFTPVEPPNYKTEKPDIYNKAAATLNSTPKGMVFDRLGTKVDMSIPPLSEEDLQQLTTPHREVYYEDQDLEDLEDLRQKLQKKLLKAETKLHLPDLRETLSNSKDKLPSLSKDESQPLPIKKDSQPLIEEKSPPSQIKSKESEVIKIKPSKVAEPPKNIDKSSEKSTIKKVDNKPNEEKQKREERSSSSVPKSPKVEKVIKDPSTQFGSLLSSIDDKILGDKKKDTSKRETSVKSDKVKVDKKDSAKKDSHSRDKKDKDNKKSEDGSKRKDHHRSRNKDHSKSSPKHYSKDRESEKHKSSRSDKSKESSSKHSSKSNEKTSSSEKSSSNVKSSEHSSTKPHNSDGKETNTFKRLADKYNPRPRKNSVEDILRSPVGDARPTVNPSVDLGNSTNVSTNSKNVAQSKDPRDPRSANQRVADPRTPVHIVADPRTTGYPTGDPRVAGHSGGDIRNNIHQVGAPRCAIQNFPSNFNANNKFYEQQPKNDAYHFNKLQNPMEHQVQSSNNQHNSIPTVIGNVLHRQPLLATPTHPMQMGFQSNNTIIRQNEPVHNNFQFIPPKQRMVNQNPMHPMSNNSFSNIYYKNNPNQMSNPVNIPYPAPSKAFHPYDPIESSSNSEYDLSKMQPVDFYSPTVTQPVNQLASPPTYGNRAFVPQAPRMERTREEAFRLGRDQNQRVQHDTRKEEPPKLAVSRDPRIRSREMKERLNATAPSKGTPASAQSKSATGEPHTKHDSLYNTNRKVSETFTSPLDSLYSSSETTKTVTSKGKGYGIQNFKIPKKKTDIIEKKTKDHQTDKKEDFHKQDDKSDIRELSSDDDVYVVETESKKPEEVPEKIVSKEKPVANVEPEVIEPSPSDPNLITEFVTQMIQSSDKQKLLNTLLSSLEDSITDKQKEAMKRIKKVIECDEVDIEEDVKHIETETANDDKDVSSTTKETEPETEITNKEPVVEENDAEEQDVEEKEEAKLEEDDSFEESDEEDKIKPKKIIRRFINTRSKKKVKRNKKRAVKKIEDLNSSFEDNVVETVSERIKSKRRIVKAMDGKPRKCRTELDMLHEDIKEMFIRDGVLTANGKRMCTMLKGDKSDSEGVSNPPLVKDKNISKVAESEGIVLDSPKRRARESNPKVLIEKTDLSKHPSQSVDESESESDDESIPLRRTRSSLKNKIPKRNIRTRSKASYKEDTSEDEKKLDQNKSITSEESKVSEEPKVSEDESMASEDETKASEEVTLDESENAASSQISNKRSKRKRRGYNWALGIIHKPKKKRASSRPATPHLEDEQPPSEAEEAVEESEKPEIEYVEPDKNYYFDPQMKPDCKLCSFKGRMIIQHYRSNHPRNEVLISKLSPYIAETAIDESKTKNYNEFEIPADASQPKFRRNKYTFQCRFCQVFLKNESTDGFFDHLTSHTGEYRFVCNFCPFRTANCKSLRSHMHSSHNATSGQTGGITPTYPSPPDFNTLFGYICSECNFVQMNRSTMERHCKIIHTGDFSKIYKISMSMIPSKNPTVDENLDQLKTKEVEELAHLEVEHFEPAIIEPTPAIVETTPEIVEPASAIVETSPEIAKTAPAIDKTVTDEVGISKKDENLNSEAADKQKPEELKTAFTIADDQEGENEKCEETKQEKMEEIQKTIIPKKRFASNLLEKLKNRLNDKIDVSVKKDVKDTDTKDKTEIKKVEDEHKAAASFSEPAEFIGGPSTSKEEQKVPIKEIPIENDLVKKGLFGKRENRSSCIPNIIERLQEQISKDTQKLPPLIPIEEFNAQHDQDYKPEETIAQVGPFIMGKKKNVISFVCYIKSCMFSSSNPVDLKTHCTTLHLSEPWDGYCISCDKTTNFTNALGAYTHLIDNHTPKEISAKAKFIKEESEMSKPYLRMRRLSGDKLSQTETLEMLNSPVTIKKEDPDVEIIDDFPAEEEEPFNFPFQITNVTSLADEEEEEKKWETSDASSPKNNTSNRPTIGIVLPILSSIKGSPPRPAVAKPVSPRQLLSRTPMFTVSPPQKVQSKKILLKDTPLQQDELIKPRKNRAAYLALLTESKLKHLYKCPERTCQYSTDTKKHFEMHLKQHVEYNSGIQIPCLYCNFKTSFNLIGIHYDIRHSKCLFCCAYCFYRAINQSYVEIHQENEHSTKTRRVIIVPQNQDALMSQASIAIPHIRSILTPYSCGQLGCEEKFVFESDFKQHLVNVHQGIPLLCVCCPHSPVNEEAAVVHAQVHNVYYYNCRYCIFGASDIDDVHKHLSQTHFALPPQIILRQYQDKGTGKSSSDFNYNDDNIFNHVLVQSSENLNYITPAAKVFSTVTTVSTPQSNIVKYTPKNANSNETITLYKAPAPSPGVCVKVLKCANTPIVKDAEVVKNPSDNEIVQVSDDEDEEPSKPIIVLNGLLAQGKNILSLSSPKVASTEPSKPPETVQNFINVQPEIINSDDCVLVPEESDKTVSADEDPLKLDSDPLSVGENESNQDKMDIDAEETDVSFDECNSSEMVTKKQGLSGTSLFRCGNCKFGFKLSNAFRSHIILCAPNSILSKNAKPFKCYHCPKTCKSSNILMDHLRLHGTPRFSCSLCDFKRQHQNHVRTHMKVRHKVTSVSINPVIPLRNNYDEDFFIMKPKFIGRSVSKDTVASNVLQDFSQINTINMICEPDQIHKLPIRPIFSENIACSKCGYQSKVRANLVRHLQFHLQSKEMPVPASAPVNPVPCLDKNEKMFDKMTNLAHSSFSDKSRMSGPSVKKEISFITKEEESKYPKFVPSTKRYVCGAYNCQYLNQEESILRNHVQTFHSDETSYKCLHCNESLTIYNEVINVENILHHLKLHDLNLYKCKYCAFMHYQKQKIEAHATEKHVSDRLHIVVIREMEQEPQDSPQIEEVKEKKPWRCGICKYRCTTKSEIVSHAYNKHEVENQYNCAMCSFKSNEKNVFESHFRVNHVGHKIEVNSTYYEAVDAPQALKPTEIEVFDTTPLWQRDKNKFKHIRGIPLDENTKLPKKSPFKAAPVFDNLDKSIEAVANGSATAVPKNSKSAVIKKPKTLKEKRMKEDSARAELFEDGNDLAIIEDVNEELPFSVTEEATFEDPVTITYNGNVTQKNLSIKDIEEMDLNMIKFGEFSCVTGKFVKPANKEYFCPVCQNFKTKRVIEFTQHLYKDLEYHRFVCTRCGLSHTSNKVLERHSIKKHPLTSLSITSLPVDTRIEDYVNKLLAYQQRVMFANSQPETVERKLETNAYGEFKSPEKCKHCSYTSKYCGDLKKHETRHWAIKPFKCGKCAFDGVTSSEVIQHSRRVHANCTPDVITVQLPENPVIIPISRKRRYINKMDSDVSSDAFEFNEENGSDVAALDSSDNMDHENNEIVYVCHYCPKRGANETEIKDHWEVIHKPKLMIFQFKKVKRSDLAKSSTVLFYKCGYCDLRTQFDTIRKHCKKAHPKMTFSAFRFKCGLKECNEYLKSYDHAKSHFSASHPGAKISYIDIPKVTSATSKINCEFCSLKFDNREKFSLHQKEMHSHLLPSFTTPEVPQSMGPDFDQYKCPECGHISYNYNAMRDHVRSHSKPFVCSYCSQRFLYPSVVKTHHNREHRDLELKYECDDAAMKRNDLLRSNILKKTKDGTFVKHKGARPGVKRSLPTSSEVSHNSGGEAEVLTPPAKKFKATARKSTTKPSVVITPPLVEEGYSYYGSKPDLEDIGSIKASLPFLDTMVKISLSDLTFINIFPVVEVEDFKKTFKF